MPKILLIEDSLKSQHVCAQSLRSEGYQIFTASNGLEGVELTHQENPDLILCDIMMPRLDGYAVLSSIREDPSTAVVPFIFWSGKASREDIRYGMDLGADDYLTKPCSITAVLKAITARLNKQKDLKQGFFTEFHKDRELTATSPASSARTLPIFPSIPRLDHIFEFIEENFCEPSISLSQVAQAAGYSPAYLTHLVKQKTERTVNAWIIERRMAEARKLLLEESMIVKEIALQIGYSDPGYFMRQFKKHHGVSAKCWQQSHC